MLGVLYHALLFGGGMMGMFGGSPTASSRLMDWIHSFRMPLFFLISGFFCHMMLLKYGVPRYLQRRWWRIALPMLLVLFCLAFIRDWTGAGGFPGGGPRGGFGRPPGGPGGPGQEMRPGDFPAPPPFEGGPDSEFGGFQPPGPGDGFSPEGGPGFDRSGEGFPGPRRGGPGFGPGGPLGASSPIAEKLFGSFARNLTLQHLWFLWYLLVFATVGPVAAGLANRLLPRRTHEQAGRVGTLVLRWGLAPLILALASVVGLVLSGTGPGQPPSGVGAIMGTFPDVLLRYDRDWPYFLIYFMSGWWLYGCRDGLPEVARTWLPVLLVGFLAYAGSKALGREGRFPWGPQSFSIADLGRHALFAVGVAFTVFGFMGFFQRHLNRPTWAGRYLADTAFWIYLVHQDLLNMLVLPWVRPWGLPQLLQAFVAVAITTAVALAAFEAVVRRTPLTNLFGPPRRRRDQVPTLPVTAGELTPG